MMPTTSITMATPTNNVRGAVVTPPGMIQASIKRQVDEALGNIPTGKTGALLAVATQDGVNLVFAHRDQAKGWEAVAWVGKSWGGDTAMGVQVKKTW